MARTIRAGRAFRILFSGISSSRAGCGVRCRDVSREFHDRYFAGSGQHWRARHCSCVVQGWARQIFPIFRRAIHDWERRNAAVSTARLGSARTSGPPPPHEEAGMSRDVKFEAALALHRFGLGPRPGSIAAIAADPRGALPREELDQRRCRKDSRRYPSLKTSGADRTR